MANNRETPWTPGPWEYVPSNENHGAYIVAQWGSDVADCYTMSNPDKAAVCNGGISKPVPFQAECMDANARLIAAAPEMVEHVEFMAESACDGPPCVFDDGLCIHCRAAALLSRIYGEQSDG